MWWIISFIHSQNPAKFCSTFSQIMQSNLTEMAHCLWHKTRSIKKHRRTNQSSMLSHYIFENYMNRCNAWIQSILLHSNFIIEHNIWGKNPLCDTFSEEENIASKLKTFYLPSSTFVLCKERRFGLWGGR